MYKLKNPSLALNWLRSLDKTLPVPVVVYADEPTDYGGLFVWPFDGEYWVEGVPVDGTKGLIIIGASNNTESNTIAHEFRHHWQRNQGWQYDGVGWNPHNDYWDNVVNYFTKSKLEMDALLWSQKKAYCEKCEQWIDYIRRETT